MTQSDRMELQVYDASGNMIAQYTTAPRERGEIEIMTVIGGNIAWVVDYSGG